MTDSLSYPSGAYMSQNAYYPSPPLHGHHGPHTHHVAPPPRQETTTRKRPKYTRSKTGCLTCRVKKIKCDEAKPSCMRCAHGQRDCTWPEGVPARKRAPSVKESPDGSNRPSTASSTASPGMSEASSPSSTRGHSPPQRSPVELSMPRDINLPPLLSNRRQEPSYHLPPMHHPSEIDTSRRDYRERSRYSPESATSHSMPPLPDAYPARYEPYSSTGHHVAQHHLSSRHTLAASSVRSTMGHPAMQQQWSPPPLMTPPEQYYQPERPLVSGDHMRYH